MADRAAKRHRREEAAARVAREEVDGDAVLEDLDLSPTAGSDLVWLLVVPGFLGQIGD